MRVHTVLPMLMLLSVGCGQQPAVDLDAERSALMDADRAWAAAQANSDAPVDAVVDQFLGDSRLLAPDVPLALGKEAIRDVFDAVASMPGFSLAWTPDFAEVASSGDLGYTIGTYRMGMDSPDGPVTINGKYMTVWKKQADGGWRVAVDMFNADGPPTPEM